MKQLLLLAVLCVAAYAPALSLPLMEDDYPNIAQALGFRSAAAPLENPIFRTRATSYWAMQGLYGAFRMTPAAYHVASLLLHIANTWLLFWALQAWPGTRAAALWAAGFFAVYEGHQEAVIWFSAINELLQFLFGGLALLLWMRGRRWVAVSVVCFGLALISKESALVFLGLLAFGAVGRKSSAPVWTILLYAALAGVAVVAIASTREYSFRFTDGSFSWRAPFWMTLPRAMGRMLWVWGLVALVILGWRERARSLAVAAQKGAPALVWMAVALLPYSFLTYSAQIPSRQTYLASAGLAALFGLAMSSLWAGTERARIAACALAAIALLHNAGYIWVKKVPQFVARARPTEQLIRVARERGGPIWIECFPLARITAEAALRLEAGMGGDEVEWSPAEAARRAPAVVFCYQAKR
jgi:hypothetical protein